MAEPTPPPAKSCPFCKEQVHADAIKCRYCQSQLLPAQPGQVSTDGKPFAEKGKTVYIVDDALVSFSKFAGTLLGIFAIVGASLYGFELKKSVAEAKDSVEEAKKSVVAANTIKNSLEKLLVEVKLEKLRIDSTEAAVNRQEQNVRSLAAEVQTLREQAVTDEKMINDIRKKTEGETIELAQKKNQEPEKFGHGFKYWPVGTILKIKFLGGSNVNRAKVRNIIMKWLPFVNLRFQFVEQGDAQIRISFTTAEGSWSYIGTDALGIPADKPTINYGWVSETNVLHDFGHALGLIHEFQNPYTQFPWNEKKVYALYESPPYFWSREDIKNNLLTPVSKTQLGPYRNFDANSIMMYEFPSQLTDGKVKSVINGLSPSDRALVARIYPRK
ncbi:MAG: peptidase [Hymenobacter sp.]|nr:peptidase [Hymenobacter sp.]